MSNKNEQKEQVDLENNNEQGKPSQKPKLNFMNKKIPFYIFERENVQPVRLTINDPKTHDVDFADYQKQFFNEFGNMISYNRGIFNRKTPQTPEVYKAQWHTEYDDLTMTSIKDIKDYLNKSDK